MRSRPPVVQSRRPPAQMGGPASKREHRNSDRDNWEPHWRTKNRIARSRDTNAASGDPFALAPDTIATSRGPVRVTEIRNGASSDVNASASAACGTAGNASGIVPPAFATAVRPSETASHGTEPHCSRAEQPWAQSQQTFPRVQSLAWLMLLLLVRPARAGCVTVLSYIQHHHQCRDARPPPATQQRSKV